MRLVKLALRMVVAWRRSVYPSVAAIVLVAALTTLTGALLDPVLVAAAHAYRTRVAGELAGEVGPAEAARLARTAREEGALVSVSVAETGTLDSAADLLLVRVRRVDLRAELAFRDLEWIADDEAFAAGDAVLLASGALVELTEGRVSRLETPGSAELLRIVASGPSSGAGPELLVHDHDVGTAPGGGPSAPSQVTVRVRGDRTPLHAEAAERLPGLEDTGWYERALETTRPLRRAAWVLAATLAALAAGTLVPSQLLLVRQARDSWLLLSAWGVSRRGLRGLATLVGAFSAGIAGAAGAGIGLLAASVLNAQGRAAVNMLPLDLALSVAEVAGDAGPGAAVVTPVMGWAIASVAVATLLGVATALPSAWIAGSVVRRRDLWHW